MFRKWGLSVRLVREVGWASIRDRLLHQDLHAAHASAAMAFAMRCGLGSLSVPCLTAFILAHNGSSITLSKELQELGVHDASSLAALSRSLVGKRRLRFASPFQYSTQSENLRTWLRSGGINPDTEVEMVVLPSPLAHKSLSGGHIDGYCVAEPWGSLASTEGVGFTVARSAGSEGLRVEKVLLVLERFEREFPEAHLAMVAAVQEASDWSANSAHRAELIRMLASRAYLDVPQSVLRRSLMGDAEEREGCVGEIQYGAGGLGAPTRERGAQVFDVLRRLGVPAECRGFRRDIISKLFREDLYARARERLPFHPPADAALHPASVTTPPHELNGSRAA